MGQKHSNKSKNNKNNNEQNNVNKENFEEQKLFQAFQEKKFSSEICAMTYFKFDSEDIIENNSRKANSQSIIENNLDLTEDSNISLSDKKNKKKVIYLEKEQIKTKLFLFLEVADNLVYVIDSHSFEKLFKFREESKTCEEKCNLMLQSQSQKCLLICVHENKININKIKIINSLNKSIIYCEQIQCIIFGKSYKSIYDLKETISGQLIISLQECLFICEKTYKDQEINMSNNEERRLCEKVLSISKFPEEREGYMIGNKGEHHYLPFKGFYLKNLKNKKIPFIEKISLKNIIFINNIQYIILINVNSNISVIRFYYIYESQINCDEKKDIVINGFKNNNLYINKLFNINEKYFRLMNIEKIYIISALNKEIVSIYVINDTKDLNLLSNINERNKINCFIPYCFLLFHDHYFLIQFIDIKTKNVYLKMFRFVISNNNFVEIFNATKKQIKSDDFIFNILSFKNVKDIKANDLNFCAKFFITNNKKNMVKKWIITDYEKE